MKTYGQDGEKLAKAYCQSCHVLPSPTELDKSTWVSKVFPVMHQYMGLEPLAQHDILPHDLKAIFPTLPMMTEDEWFTVAQWYIDNAPAELPAPPPVSISGTTGVFTSTPIVRSDVIPMTTFVHYDTSRRSIVLGDGMTNAVHLTNVDGRILQSIQIPGPPSAIAVRNDRWYITNMGKLLPHDSAVGSLVEITWDGSAAKTRVVLDSLRRPTHVIVEDLNGDGRPDFLICEYGNLIGQFGWYEVLRNGKIVYHQLSPLPGALRAIVRDVNGDKRPDILVQMAQARESLVMYINQGKGRFSADVILEFPPSRGSSSFQLVNGDSDADLELLYTAGDNGDYDIPPYKPYHGVYIFDNTPSGWKQSFFQRMDGAYGAWLADFSQDGVNDLLSFSYFPRFDRGDIDLIRFDQDVFSQEATTWNVQGASQGRWLVSHVADIDQDGDLDVILGNVSIGPGFVPQEVVTRWTSKGVLGIILKNTSR